MREFKEITLRESITYRGGGIEISLDTFGFENEKMTAYQNYLGGGMLGRILNDCTINGWSQNDRLIEISEDLSRYFHSLTNHSDSEWESATFEENQKRPTSNY